MDWIGAAINLIGWFIMPNHRLRATGIFLIGNIVWISWGFDRATWSIVILQGFFIFLNVRAIYMWPYPRMRFDPYVDWIKRFLPLTSSPNTWGEFAMMHLMIAIVIYWKFRVWKNSIFSSRLLQLQDGFVSQKGYPINLHLKPTFHLPRQD